MQINGKRSEWGCLMSGVTHGLIFGPLTFIIYINDADAGISSDVSNFADDIKISKVIESN